MTDLWHSLPHPPGWRTGERHAFTTLAHALEEQDIPTRDAARDACLALDNTALTAAAHVLIDIVSQGWSIKMEDDGEVVVAPPIGVADPVEEKQRVRRQELIKREEQLSTPSVRRFVSGMERPREHQGAFVSIFNLMRDGDVLAAELRTVVDRAVEDPTVLRSVIDPYVQIVTRERCELTGFKLTDIWRYFRHTWSNQYTSTPGRTLMILVRDRAAPFHPVIGIAALGSAVVQLAERDDWIGWQPSVFLRQLRSEPSLRMARWIVARLKGALRELHLDDLIKDGLYWPTLWDHPAANDIERLMKEAANRRESHHRFVKAAEFKRVNDPESLVEWRRRAESDLFRSKRCLALADLLKARLALGPYLYPTPTSAGLSRALEDPGVRRAIMSVLKRTKAEAVGTEIADLTVCGAVAPYNALLGGKLVSMLATSPSVVRAYRERYSEYASEIASSMAGRPIRRRSNLVFIGTTSLYGSGASQYNRIRIPVDVLNGNGTIEFRRLGRSKSFGTSHLSGDAVRSLVRLAEQTANGARVNSIFGEGVNPKLRKVRHGLDLLGWPSDVLLQHGRQRIIYGISLVNNLLSYLLGVDAKPRYKFRRTGAGDVEAIGDWWMRRWLSRRIGASQVLETVAQHRLERPVRHGARVSLPQLPVSSQDSQQPDLY